MLVGLVAAGFYNCFYSGVRGAMWVGAGTAGLELSAILFPEIRPAVSLMTALWIMLVGVMRGAVMEGRVPAGLTGCLYPGRERGGSDRVHGHDADEANGRADTGSVGRYGQKPDIRRACREDRDTAPGFPAVQWERLFVAGGVWMMARGMAGMCTGNALQQIDLLRTALAAAMFVMAELRLLGRGKLHPLWMTALAIMWLLVGFLGSFAYAEIWQKHVMTISLYVTAGGLLVFQQICCIRQELGGLMEKQGEPQRVSPGGMSGASLGAGPTFGTGEGWREEAGREYRQLAIFEHDFRHHLDIVAALYEEGSGEEARSYIEDLKQARESRQGRIPGGERELSYIMMAKRKACRQAEIFFSYQIVGAPRGIARMDMTALLLNLMDNAIRACREAPKPRSIEVMLLSRGELWEIEMVNSGHYEPEKVQQSKQQQEELQVGVMKRKVHGIGMVSVKQIVDKYQGIWRIWEEDGQVRQKLILVQLSGQKVMGAL